MLTAGHIAALPGKGFAYKELNTSIGGRQEISQGPRYVSLIFPQANGMSVVAGVLAQSREFQCKLGIRINNRSGK